MTENKEIVKLAKGLLAIAKTAMPDSYFENDRRCQFARKMLAKYQRKRKGK